MTTTSPSAKSLLVASIPVVFVILWATGFAMTKIVAGHIAPVWFLAIRFAIATLVMVMIALVMRAPWPNAKGAAHAATTGALLHALYLSPIYWAVSKGFPGGVSSLFVALQPFFTAFIAVPFLGERVTLKHWLGIVIGFAGVALVLTPKLQTSFLGGITPFTSALCILAVFCAALGSVYQKGFAAHLPLTTGGVWQYVGATTVALLASLVLQDFHFDNSVTAWSALAWSVLVLSIGSVLLLMVMINKGEVSRVSTLLFLVPSLAALMTYTLYGETLTWVQLLGMAACAGAVLIANRG